MPRKATDQEEGLLSGEVTLRPEQSGVEFPLVTLKVVYLGGHPTKFVRLKGSMIEEKYTDDEGEDGIVKKADPKNGTTGYDFAVVDSRGRKIKVNVTADGRRFALVTHPAHQLAFYRMRGLDGEPQFEFRGRSRDIATFDAFRKAARRRVDAEQGPAVLRQMGLDREDAD